MADARGSNGFGPNPLTFLEIAAWMRLRDWRLSPDEALIIRAMDRSFLAASSKYLGPSTEGGGEAAPLTMDVLE